jgi:endogenous inhibitor of DNA gyrase (YacG/DUF329 family)
MDRTGPLASCPACGKELDGGPVVFWCPCCHRRVQAADLDVEIRPAGRAG